MGIEIKKTGTTNGKLNMLVYGRPGAGKTRFIGSTYPKFKALILSAESGLLSLNNIKDSSGKTVEFDHVEVKSWADVEEFYKFIQFSKHDYACVAMDSGTEIQNVCMDGILRDENR